MKKFCKVVILWIYVFVGVLTIPFVSYAKEAATYVEPRMTYIAGYSTDLVISNAGIATITGQVRGKTGVTQAYIKVTLQKYVSGHWANIEEWENSQNARNAFISETYQVTKGTYRVVMKCSANSESKTATSVQRTF